MNKAKEQPTKTPPVETPPAVTPPVETDLFEGSNISKDIQDDPDMIAAMKEFKGDAKDGQKPVVETKVEDALPPHTVGAEGVYKNAEGKEETVVVEKINEDGTVNIKIGDKNLENIKKELVITKKEEESEYNFEEDVTIGDIVFKKETLKSTPIEVLESISKLQTKLIEIGGKTATAELKTKELLNDPIIKDRLQRIESGKADEKYSTYGMSKQAYTAIKDKLDLTEEEMQTVMAEFRSDMEDNTRKAVGEALLREKNDVEAKTRISKGVDVLLGLGDINPEWKINEKDIEKIWRMKDAHPEFNKFINGIGRAQKHLVEKYGMKNYSEVAKFSPKAVYAMVAADLDLPLAFNTKERDTLIRTTERDRLLSIFNPKKVYKAMSQKSENETTKKQASLVNDGAIDKDKINDMDYIGRLYDNCKTPEEIDKLTLTLRRVATS